MNYKKILHIALCTVLTLALFSCKGEDKNAPEQSGTNSTSGQSGLYLGVLGFNKDYKTYPIQKLTQSTKSDCKSWINALSIANNTDLYYAEWAALNMLQEFNAPADLENASIITFTDGLDRGSYFKIEQFKNDGNNNKLIEQIQNRLKNDKVNNVSLSAYSIGVRGSDVNDDKIGEFENTLKNLVADPELNSYKVNNMQEVESKFKAIADDLHKVNTISDVVLKSVRYDDGTYISWTFDLDDNIDKWNVGAAGVPTSKRYITSKLNLKDGKWFISEIKYDGLVYDSNGATTLEGVYEESTEMIRFEFKNVRDKAGNAITDISKLRQWNRSDENKNWGPESEFNRNNIPTPEVKDKSAVVMLVLDCSSSLGESGLAQLKAAAKNFIDIIASGNSGSSSGGNITPDPIDPVDPVDNKSCWEITYTYGGSSETYYMWGTQAELQSEIKEMNDYGMNANYRAYNVNDEYSCSALNQNEPQPSAAYYIKHPWGTGKDSDWSWEAMEQMDSDTYYYVGYWGGVGANINTQPTDSGAEWISEANIIFQEGSCSIGELVIFFYIPNTNQLVVVPYESSAINKRIISK